MQLACNFCNFRRYFVMKLNENANIPRIWQFGLSMKKCNTV